MPAPNERARNHETWKSRRKITGIQPSPYSFLTLRRFMVHEWRDGSRRVLVAAHRCRYEATRVRALKFRNRVFFTRQRQDSLSIQSRQVASSGIHHKTPHRRDRAGIARRRLSVSHPRLSDRAHRQEWQVKRRHRDSCEWGSESLRTYPVRFDTRLRKYGSLLWRPS